ncbi:uncharacterized protein LOC142344213 [Convolutriloba macropyga]|uniref:uncharacterized protein LOC142344213 n=1 Tax=Convolutriloba macropyga TaxID=536237 RepID=UPI003F524C88
MTAIILKNLLFGMSNSDILRIFVVFTFLILVQIGYVHAGVNKSTHSNHTNPANSEQWGGLASYDDSVMKCGGCRMNLLSQSNSSSWLEMHSTVNQSASGAAAVTFVNPFARNKSPPPTAVIRTALFSQQSPCFVTSQTGGGNNDVTVKQVRCESVQLFVCGSVSESDESVPESLTKSCKDNTDTCWNDDIDASSADVPGCLAKPNPGSLRSTGGGGGYGGHRIINGVNADIREHPWAVSLTIEDPEGEMFVCGASIIGKNLILTARHCLASFDIKTALIHMLMGTSTRKRSKAMDKSIYTVIFHPDKNVDLVLIKLKNPIEFTSTVGAIALPPNKDTFPKEDDWVTAIGWGTMCDDPPECKVEEKMAHELQSVEIQVANREKTAARYETSEDDPEEGLTPGKLKRSFFAGGKQVYPDSNSAPVKKDACGGDSGAALECKTPKTGQKFLCGVTSFGPSPPFCGEDPGGYVMVWLDEILTFLNKQLEDQANWRGGVVQTKSPVSNDGTGSDSSNAKTNEGSKGTSLTSEARYKFFQPSTIYAISTMSIFLQRTFSASTI